MKNYVLGFGLSKDKSKIVLIKKERPDWQKGKYNGIGGKVELTDISIYDSMYREFFEETDVLIDKDDWMYFAKIHNDNCDPNINSNEGYNVYCFKTYIYITHK
jgi:8-oxo-dGTP diphosphatase